MVRTLAEARDKDEKRSIQWALQVNVLKSTRPKKTLFFCIRNSYIYYVYLLPLRICFSRVILDKQINFYEHHENKNKHVQIIIKKESMLCLREPCVGGIKTGII